jgi:hypothetical protein
MPADPTYREQLNRDLGIMIDAMDLTEEAKFYLRFRWLDQVLWMEDRANSARDRHYGLRLTTIIGGVVIPALIGLNIGGTIEMVLRAVILGIGLLVAISAAIEEFFKYGERWRHYRRTVEGLKIEGWQFFQLSSPYDRYEKHTDAYRAFVARVEAILQRDVEMYITEVVRHQDEEKGKAASAVGTPEPKPG